MEYRIFVERMPGCDTTEIYGVAHRTDGKSFYITIEDQHLKLNPFAEGGRPEPFLTLSRIDNNLLQALTEGLKAAGYVAEVDNSQRIVAEALAKERKEELAYQKDFVKELVNKLVK